MGCAGHLIAIGIGYAPRDILEGRAPAIQAERERKLRETRDRRISLVKNGIDARLTVRRETESDSAGGQAAGIKFFHEAMEFVPFRGSSAAAYESGSGEKHHSDAVCRSLEFF